MYLLFRSRTPLLFHEEYDFGTDMEDLEHFSLLSISDSQATELSTPIHSRFVCKWRLTSFIPYSSFCICYINRLEFEKIIAKTISLLGALKALRNHDLLDRKSHDEYPLTYNLVEVQISGGITRPTKFYRAIHNGYYREGLHARGCGTLSHSSNFQVQVENHLSWGSRKPSPFLSVTSEKSDAQRKCKQFQEQKRQGVELLEIDATGSGWNHSIQLVWDVKDLVDAFDLEWKPYYRGEYLIEQSIPRECVTSISWNCDHKIFAL